MSVDVPPVPRTTAHPARVPVEVRLAPRVLEAARTAAAQCSTTLPTLIEELLDTWLAARRCQHGVAGPPAPPGDEAA